MDCSCSRGGSAMFCECRAEGGTQGEAPDRGAECEGHPAGPFDPMGETVYCDGSCRRIARRVVPGVTGATVDTL
jgi:hypothetical protein